MHPAEIGNPQRKVTQVDLYSSKSRNEGVLHPSFQARQFPPLKICLKLKLTYKIHVLH